MECFWSPNPKCHFSLRRAPLQLSPPPPPPPPLRRAPLQLSRLRSPSPPRSVAELLHRTTDTCHAPVPSHPGIDRSGRFCSPRSARELALMICYAACLDGCDPVQLFHKKLNAKRVPGFVFDKELLLSYDHMSFGKEPIQVQTEEEAQQLMHQDETASAFEADVLSAPLKLVYGKFVLRFTREILEAVASGWNQRIHVINRVIPQHWRNEAASRIIELCIMHIAMAEITSKGTKHQIVINEAVDLAKRFCDGRAPRVINGCLRTFVKQQSDRDSRADLPADNPVEQISESEAIQQT